MYVYAYVCICVCVPLRRASSGKSPQRRDSGCESSESINGSPELSPPMSSLPGGSVFGTADTKGTPSEVGGTLVHEHFVQSMRDSAFYRVRQT